MKETKRERDLYATRVQVAWNALQATHEKEVRYDDEADLFIVRKVNGDLPHSSHLLQCVR